MGTLWNELMLTVDNMNINSKACDNALYILLFSLAGDGYGKTLPSIPTSSNARTKQNHNSQKVH